MAIILNILSRRKQQQLLLRRRRHKKRRRDEPLRFHMLRMCRRVLEKNTNSTHILEIDGTFMEFLLQLGVEGYVGACFFFPNCTQTWPIWSDPMLEVRNLNGHNDMVSRKLNGFWLPCDSSRDQTCGVWVWYLRGSSYSSGLMWTSRHLAQAKN